MRTVFILLLVSNGACLCADDVGFMRKMQLYEGGRDGYYTYRIPSLVTSR